jgi:hypothetical protein
MKSEIRNQNSEPKMENRNSKFGALAARHLPLATAVLLASCFWLLTSFASGGATTRTQPVVFTVDTPAITITGASADSASTPTTAAHEAEINWTFGTVSGTYSTCTAQAKTSIDGTNYLTLGSAASVTVTSNTVNQWTVLAQGASTSAVTTSAVSSTAALGFGQLTKFTFACSAYGTSAPVTVTVIYR